MGSGDYVILRGVLSFTERKKWQGVSTKGENGKSCQLEIYGSTEYVQFRYGIDNGIFELTGYNSALALPLSLLSKGGMRLIYIERLTLYLRLSTER